MLDNYIRAFVGYSNNISTRLNGSSGGVGTEIFEYLLNQKIVDGVIGVGYGETDVAKPIYKYIDLATDVSKLSGSKYVFMGYKELVSIIEQYQDKKIVVVCQPCFSAVLRKKFKNIEDIISFFCGYNIGYDATEYLLKKSNIDIKDIQNINYRGGKYPGGFTVYKKNGEVKTFGKQYYELVDLMFLRKGCDACGFYISDNADIVLGDAWLKNITSTSLILVNSNKANNLLRSLFNDNRVTLSNIRKEDIFRMHKHNIKYKKYGHSKIMSFIVKIFNSKYAPIILPFYILGFISKIRRMFAIGITAKFKEIIKYNE
jgi:coenzyme F420-reducing hydrogenase beta subunit